jgi:organic radical activating enzyme
MKTPIKITQEKTLMVYWILTDFCNFSCNYCPDFLHSGDFATGKKPGFPTDDEIFKFIDQLQHISETKNIKLQVQFGGGEPLLHPLLPEIIARLKTFTEYVGITTNGSRNLNWWKQVLPLYNVSISLHHEYTKIEKINELGNFILENNLSSLMFNLSCDPRSWDQSMLLYEQLDDQLKPFVSPKVLNYIGTTNKKNFSYTTEQTDRIKQLSALTRLSPSWLPQIASRKIYFDDGSEENFSLPRITINNWNQFKGWSCAVSSECINVNFKGEVSAGVCKVKPLGTLINFSLDETSTVCPFNYCVCPGDIRASKTENLVK